MPERYALVKAASYLGVPPWELAERPTYWRDTALEAYQAEQQVEAERLQAMFKGKK